MAKKAYIGVPEFVQPVLTADGALGGSAFAVYASNYHSADYAAYKAFNGNANDGYSSSVNPSSQTIYLTFYNPVAIKVSAIAFTNVPSGLTSSSPKAFSVQGGNDNRTWATIGNFTNTNNTNGATWSVNLSGGFYKYHRLVITSANTTQAYMNIGEIAITATQETAVARKIKKGYIGVENFVPRALPEGYTQLSHIEATGAQYFDTGFSPNQDTRVVCKAQYTDVSGSFCLFGARYSVNERRYDFLVTGSRFYSEYNNNSGTYPTLSATTDVLEIDKNKNVTTVNGVTHSTHNYAAFQAPCNMLLFAENTNGTVSLHAKAKVWDYLVYDNGTLIRDYVPCKNPSGVVGLYDMVNGTFGGSATSTPFVAGDTYESVARKIKKAYIGIGGVARPCWSGGELAYYGTITALSDARYDLAATSVGNYALFGGGRNRYQWSSNVDAYNSSLVRSTPTTLTNTPSNLAATTVGSYALFGGGQANSSTVDSKVTAYDTSLTRSTAPNLPTGRDQLAAATIGNYALFGGGYQGSRVAVVEGYDTSLTRANATELSVARYMLAATATDSHAIFAGGYNVSDVVDAYDKSRTRTIAPKLNAARFALKGATVGNHALFGGGDMSGVFNVSVDAYDTSLTRTSCTPFTVDFAYYASASVDGFALFAGGRKGASYYQTVHVYDESLTMTSSMKLASAKSNLAGVSVGSYALFGGGGQIGNYAYSDTVDAFVVA